MDPHLASTSTYDPNEAVSDENTDFGDVNQLRLQRAKDTDSDHTEPRKDYDQKEANSVQGGDLNVDSEDQPEDLPVLTDIPTVHQSSECELCWPEVQKSNEQDESTVKARKLNREEDWISWIQCEVCSKWFHCRCVKVEDFMMPLIQSYHCVNCSVTNGPSKMKEQRNPHRHEFYKDNQGKKPAQIGTKAFVDNFKLIHMSIPEAPQEVVKVFENGTEFMQHFDDKNEWKISYKVLNKKGLGLKMPPPDFQLDDVIQILGARLQVDTIDVYAQQTYKMSLESFREVWKGDRSRLYNILSLEFSDTPLEGIVKSPKLARNLSWACKFWPKASKQEELGEGIGGSRILEDCNSEFRQFHDDSKPFVEHFCLVGMEGSFTDFHIDFGGSSVWYHVFLGEKVFYIAMPTEENLCAFIEHQSNTPGQLMRVHVKQGETLFIPSGVIHAVFTPLDSLVFGGNFLHCLNVAMQLSLETLNYFDPRSISRINQMEEEANLDYRWSVLDTLKEANHDENSVDEYIMSAVEALIPKLTHWLQTEQEGEKKPTFIKFSKILKELEKAYKNQKGLKRRLVESAGHESPISASDEDDEEEEFSAKGKIRLKLKIKCKHILGSIFDTEGFFPQT
uniref:JmjC domain-containing protein n=1 Tax=Ditylenchus dipsaci TaxID=166011 RepID=A0A915DQS1_9BILA